MIGLIQLRRYAALAFLAPFALTLPLSCSDDSENGACAWLFAPATFVDAGQPGCSAEPAGQRCDPSTGRCEAVCGSDEYLLTCQRGPETRRAIAEEALQDPVVSGGRAVACTPVVTAGASPEQTAYCCRCGQ